MRDDFAHRLRLDSIAAGQRLDLVADETERTAIAERLRLASLERLEAHAVLEREGSQVRARGRVRAALEQSCIATGEPVAEHVDEAFDISFLPAPVEGAPDEEIELGPEDCDTVFYDAQAIDLGEAIADTLALAMQPYPRSPDAEDALKQAGVLSEAEASPFAALAKLKRGEDLT
ncbi:MAG: DUF177 domain-containing protein [Pseudomonadota bacterium]|nr:DUF177 domain-containing protein [Pseudomonadota bacterium]